MAWIDDQLSVSDSAPVELYEFVTPQTTYRRTTFQSNWTYASNLYTRFTSERSEGVVAVPGEGHDMDVSIPYDDPIVRDNVTGIPAVLRSTMVVTIRRHQQVSGETRVIWGGPVRGVTIAEHGRVAKFRVPDGLEDALRSDCPRPRAQRKCNHKLYDSMCQILEVDHDHPTTVVSIDGYVVEVATFDADEQYKNGQLEFNGERRTIVAQDGTLMTIDAPFRGIAAASAVVLYAGCENTAEYCSSQFANIQRFGGMPGLPTKNPHLRYVVNGS